jgi:putative hydrolase of the HAD superfamily
MALETLGVDASDAWIVGDNFEWEVVHPKRLGLTCVWVDVEGAGPPKHEIVPDRVVRSIAELRDLIE